MDRRVKKTRAAIFTAFLELLSKKKLESITIGEIADLADINRVTVYQHFTDKYDLLEKCTLEYIDNMLAACGTKDELEVVAESFQYMKDNKEIFQLLLNNNSSNILHQSLKDEFRNRFPLHSELNVPESLYGNMKTEIIISAITGMFEWWIDGSDSYSVEDAVESYIHIRNDFFPEA